MDFVVQVEGSPGQTDNNRGKDFRLPLQNAPTAEQVVRSRAQEASRFEAAAIQVGMCGHLQSSWQLWEPACRCVKAFSQLTQPAAGTPALRSMTDNLSTRRKMVDACAGAGCRGGAHLG